MITEIEQETMDMDWFITDSKYVGFMASGGGKLPESIAKSKKPTLIAVGFCYSAVHYY